MDSGSKLDYYEKDMSKGAKVIFAPKLENNTLNNVLDSGSNKTITKKICPKWPKLFSAKCMTILDCSLLYEIWYHMDLTCTEIRVVFIFASFKFAWFNFAHLVEMYSQYFNSHSFKFAQVILYVRSFWCVQNTNKK